MDSTQIKKKQSKLLMFSMFLKRSQSTCLGNLVELVSNLGYLNPLNFFENFLLCALPVQLFHPLCLFIF